MGWESITHSCGHNRRVRLYGPHSDRDCKAAWMAAQPCLECARLADRATDGVNREDWGLPPLAGSARQIAWATAIRNQWIDRVTAALLDEAALAEDDDSRDRVADYAAIVRGWATSMDDAAWWIDHKRALKSPFAPVTAAIKQARRDGRWHRRSPVIVVDGASYEPGDTLPDGRSVMSVITTAAPPAAK